MVACGSIYLALGDRNVALMLLDFVLIVIVMTFVQKRRSQAALDALPSPSTWWCTRWLTFWRRLERGHARL